MNLAPSARSLARATLLAATAHTWAADAVVTSTTAIFTEPAVAQPAYLGSFQDPQFKTTITRIAEFNQKRASVTWGNRVRHHYSKTQPWNADMSLLLIHNDTDQGATIARTPRYLLLDGGDYRFLFGLDFAPWEYRWHPTDPDLLYYLFQNRVATYNVRTRRHTLIRQFDEYPATNGAITLLYEGNVSHDGNWVALLAPVSQNYEIFPLDLRTGEKHPALVVPRTQPGGHDLDWASISPSGDYLVLQWDDTLTEVYTRDLVKVRALPTNISHYDMTIEDGLDIAVGVRKPSASGAPSGPVVKVPLAAGAATVINSRGFASHTSARNLRRPGWAFSSYSTTWSETSWAPYYSEVVAIKTDGSGAVQRLGHFRNNKTDYYAENQPVPSPDGQRVIFASNWNAPAPGRPVGDYVIDCRDLRPFLTPTAYRPAPTDGSHHVRPRAPGLLAWAAGMDAALHRVYFGHEAAAVSSRAAHTWLGTTGETSFRPGRLAPQTTYYWAIDEITASGAVTPGPLWSFTTNRGETEPLFFDSFEDTTLPGAGWTPSDTSLATLTTAPERAGRVARLRSGASITCTLDTRGHADIHTKFARALMTADARLSVECSADGAGWHAQPIGGEPAWENFDLALGDTATEQPALRVRFRAESGEVLLDGVTVDGVPPVPEFADPAASRLANLAVRAALVPHQPLTAGFVIRGPPSPVLVRGIGPGLAPFLGGAMLATGLRLEVRDARGGLVRANEAWGGAVVLAEAFRAVGAFPLEQESRDTALLHTLDGVHTAGLASAGGGLGLIEVYDAGAGGQPRLANLSARYPAGVGAAALIAGFAIDGAAAKSVLIRGVGPGLGQFGLTGILSDPRLEVFDSRGRSIASNDDWPASFASLFREVGAFGLATGSKDAALLITLPPGTYTASISAGDGRSGEGLVEIYAVP